MGRRANRDRTPRQRLLAELCAQYGTTWRGIAAELGCSHSTLARWAGGADAGGIDETAVRTAAKGLE